jgi:hypothetical protein
MAPSGVPADDDDVDRAIRKVISTMATARITVRVMLARRRISAAQFRSEAVRMTLRVPQAEGNVNR